MKVTLNILIDPDAIDFNQPNIAEIRRCFKAQFSGENGVISKIYSNPNEGLEEFSDRCVQEAKNLMKMYGFCDYKTYYSQPFKATALLTNQA